MIIDEGTKADRAFWRYDGKLVVSGKFFSLESLLPMRAS